VNVLVSLKPISSAIVVIGQIAEKQGASGRMEMGCLDSDHASNSEKLIEVVKKRRSGRRFEKGKKVGRELPLKIAEVGRWARLKIR
jgi:hypothetical protein